jgi:hypothetical protein
MSHVHRKGGIWVGKGADYHSVSPDGYVSVDLIEAVLVAAEPAGKWLSSTLVVDADHLRSLIAKAGKPENRDEELKRHWDALRYIAALLEIDTSETWSVDDIEHAIRQLRAGEPESSLMRDATKWIERQEADCHKHHRTKPPSCTCPNGRGLLLDRLHRAITQSSESP